jgi:hypothetical protein
MNYYNEEKKMKKIALFFLCLASMNSFAGAVEDAIEAIEKERNAHCVRISQSLFVKCIGQPKTCFYNMKFRCTSPETTFEAKLKVVEDIRGDLKVRKVIIK